MHFYFPAQLVGDFLPSAIFWTSRRHRCPPFSPPVRAFNFYRAYGSAFQLLVDFHRTLLTYALALSANNHFFMQEKVPTNMCTRWELNLRMDFSGHEDNLPGHRGRLIVDRREDRWSYVVLVSS